eukprot:CAMPEP_0174237666 /NCGR_PEP_ID=MMETSP0417-20130205/9018_1 /TAXON_ID=242541 /ORGANISM="Mayorella sp, Strain BSH-02190019" /LENGTH=302 /DNA_ID=CAMNT_0015316447 /DNA_START=1 /DNA_END=906 /DNA_ORIENTATION=-
MAAASDHEKSEVIFKYGTQDVSTDRKDSQKGARQELHIKRLIQCEVRKRGIHLASRSEDLAFSRHGSKHEQTVADRLNDLDIYVVFHGVGFVWGGRPLWGHTRDVTNDPAALHIPLKPCGAIELMLDIVKTALPSSVDLSKVRKSKRGVAIVGMNRRDYDIIPAFLRRDGEEYFHVIPNGTGEWTLNPTDQFISKLNKLQDKNKRDAPNKIVAFKDMIKVFKGTARALEWKHKYGISSYMIKWAVIFSYEDGKRSVFNHKQADKACSRLAEYVRNGQFFDPIEHRTRDLKKQAITGQDLLNG